MKLVTEINMSCCGQHRNILPAVTGAIVPASVAIAPDANQQGTAFGAYRSLSSSTASSGVVTLRYREHTRIQVRGPVTGRSYTFGPAQPTPVDGRDADVLLRSRQFQRAASPPR